MKYILSIISIILVFNTVDAASFRRQRAAECTRDFLGYTADSRIIDLWASGNLKSSNEKYAAALLPLQLYDNGTALSTAQKWARDPAFVRDMKGYALLESAKLALPEEDVANLRDWVADPDFKLDMMGYAARKREEAAERARLAEAAEAAARAAVMAAAVPGDAARDGVAIVRPLAAAVPEAAGLLEVVDGAVRVPRLLGVAGDVGAAVVVPAVPGMRDEGAADAEVAAMAVGGAAEVRNGAGDGVPEAAAVRMITPLPEADAADGLAIRGHYPVTPPPHARALADSGVLGDGGSEDDAGSEDDDASTRSGNASVHETPVLTVGERSPGTPDSDISVRGTRISPTAVLDGVFAGAGSLGMSTPARGGRLPLTAVHIRGGSAPSAAPLRSNSAARIDRDRATSLASPTDVSPSSLSEGGASTARANKYAAAAASARATAKTKDLTEKVRHWVQLKNLSLSTAERLAISETELKRVDAAVASLSGSTEAVNLWYAIAVSDLPALLGNPEVVLGRDPMNASRIALSARETEGVDLTAQMPNMHERRLSAIISMFEKFQVAHDLSIFDPGVMKAIEQLVTVAWDWTPTGIAEAIHARTWKEIIDGTFTHMGRGAKAVKDDLGRPPLAALGEAPIKTVPAEIHEQAQAMARYDAVKAWVGEQSGSMAAEMADRIALRAREARGQTVENILAVLNACTINGIQLLDDATLDAAFRDGEASEFEKKKGAVAGGRALSPEPSIPSVPFVKASVSPLEEEIRQALERGDAVRAWFADKASDKSITPEQLDNLQNEIVGLVTTTNLTPVQVRSILDNFPTLGNLRKANLTSLFPPMYPTAVGEAAPALRPDAGVDGKDVKKGGDAVARAAEETEKLVTGCMVVPRSAAAGVAVALVDSMTYGVPAGVLPAGTLPNMVPGVGGSHVYGSLPSAAGEDRGLGSVSTPRGSVHGGGGHVAHAAVASAVAVAVHGTEAADLAAALAASMAPVPAVATNAATRAEPAEDDDPIDVGAAMQAAANTMTGGPAAAPTEEVGSVEGGAGIPLSPALGRHTHPITAPGEDDRG